MTEELLHRVSQKEFHIVMNFMAGSVWTFTKVDTDVNAKGEPVTFVTAWFKNKDGITFGATKTNFLQSRDTRNCEMDDADCVFHFLNIEMVGLAEHFMEVENEQSST